MPLRPRVHIAPPDATTWRRSYPDGLGASAFASPAFQRLMLHDQPGDWVLRALSVDGSEAWLPVLGRCDRYGRWILRAHPVGYDLLPVPLTRLDQAELDHWIHALCTPRIQHFVWWLPSWHTAGLQLKPHRTLTGEVEVEHHVTYTIPFGGEVQAHMREHVSTTMRRYARRNAERGVTVSSDPTPAQIEAYIEIYERSFRDNAWEGEMFDRAFFYAVARELGRGGTLAVVLHEGVVVGGGVLMLDPAVIHYFQGAIDRDAKKVYPHVALYTHALELAAQQGIGWVNLGGVNEGNTGLEWFKSAWGAHATASPMLVFTSGLRKTIESVQRRLPAWLPRRLRPR